LTLDDWTKLLDVALADTQNTCVTLTEVPDTEQDLRSVIAVARAKADAAGMCLSRLELPADRYDEAADFPGAVGVAVDVVRLTFSAVPAASHDRRIFLPNRTPPEPLAKPAANRARARDRRSVALRRRRDSVRTSDVRQI
jgi:hypothetical protein